MEKKEKLEGSYDVPQLKQKLNEIIDYLNTQSQPEEYSKTIEPLEEGKIYSGVPISKSTPEEKEDWEEKWEEFFLYVTNNKNWVDGRPEWKGNVYITLYNAMKDFIRQLLEERERERYERGRKDQQQLDGLIYGTTVSSTTTLEEGWKLKDPKKLKKELDKLSSKENGRG